MSGVEVHAQFLENLVEGSLLSRPRYTKWIEIGWLLVGGLLLIVLVPRQPARASVGLLAVLVVALSGAGLLFYLKMGILLDAAIPSVALAILFSMMLVVALTETQTQRRALRRQVELQREAAARLAGELEAARRIQMGTLPRPGAAFPGETRFDLYAMLEPAREVGGDLYDFFLLDADHLFFMIGDVSGKGLPGSLFMAISKALYKSTALRRHGQVAVMMREADAEISRDNSEGFFVTVLAGILDARTGELEYCSAGHEPPPAPTPPPPPEGKGGGGGWARRPPPPPPVPPPPPIPRLGYFIRGGHERFALPAPLHPDAIGHDADFHQLVAHPLGAPEGECVVEGYRADPIGVADDHDLRGGPPGDLVDDAAEELPGGRGEVVPALEDGEEKRGRPRRLAVQGRAEGLARLLLRDRAGRHAAGLGHSRGGEGLVENGLLTAALHAEHAGLAVLVWHQHVEIVAHGLGAAHEEQQCERHEGGLAGHRPVARQFFGSPVRMRNSVPRTPSTAAGVRTFMAPGD